MGGGITSPLLKETLDKHHGECVDGGKAGAETTDEEKRFIRCLHVCLKKKRLMNTLSFVR